VARTAIVAALCALVAPAASSAETLADLLASRALESVVHPIAAEFVAAEGAAALDEQQRATAIAQLKRSLERQTNPMMLTMRGAGGMMNTEYIALPESVLPLDLIPASPRALTASVSAAPAFTLPSES